MRIYLLLGKEHHVCSYIPYLSRICLMETTIDLYQASISKRVRHTLVQFSDLTLLNLKKKKLSVNREVSYKIFY